MRTPVIVLAMTMFLLPPVLSAQQREPAPQAGTDSAPATVAAQPAVPRSLMGKVMATLIESAERTAREQKLAREQIARQDARDRADVTTTLAVDPTARMPEDHITQDQVAVQEP